MFIQFLNLCHKIETLSNLAHSQEVQVKSLNSIEHIAYTPQKLFIATHIWKQLYFYIIVAFIYLCRCVHVLIPVSCTQTTDIKNYHNVQ